MATPCASAGRSTAQTRFRINLESIISKYDKPFEDSPIIDLNDMSVVENGESLTAFQPFGHTALATDIRKGKTRKGGISSDSALGSTVSVTKSDLSSSEDDSYRNMYLKDLDFTHENSDALGAFIRYRNHSKLKKAQIVGLDDDKRAAQSSDGDVDSEDDLGSVCSGPSHPHHRAKLLTPVKATSNRDDDAPRQETTQNEMKKPTSVNLSASDKVNSWLSDDAFFSASCHGNDGPNHQDVEEVGNLDDSLLDEHSQESDCSYLSSDSEDEDEGEDGSDGGRAFDGAASLLQLKERFVKKMQSILVEGSCERSLENLSSSADEMVLLPDRECTRSTDQSSLDEVFKSTKRKPTVCKQTHHNDQRFHPEQTSQSGLEDAYGSTSGKQGMRGGSDGPVNMCSHDPTHVANRSVITAEDTVLAGHFDESHAESEMVVEAPETSVKLSGKEVELKASPDGKTEITILDPTHPPPDSRTSSISCSSSRSGTLSPSHKRFPRTPSYIKNSAFSGKPALSPSTRCKGEAQDSSQKVLNDVMEFFKSPLHKMLTSPMPKILSNSSIRTVQGKRVHQTSSSVPRGVPISHSVKEDKGTNSSTDAFPGTFKVKVPKSLPQVSQSAKTVKSEEASKQCKLDALSSSGTVLKISDVPSQRSVDPETALVDGKEQHLFSRRHNLEIKRQALDCSTEEEDVSLLTEDSGDATELGLERVPAIDKCVTPSQSNETNRKQISVSKTPSITSPFGHMVLDSGKRSSSKPGSKLVRHLESRGQSQNIGASRGLVFTDDIRHHSKNVPEKNQDLTVLTFSDSDDEDEEMESPEKRHGEHSHNYMETDSRSDKFETNQTRSDTAGVTYPTHNRSRLVSVKNVEGGSRKSVPASQSFSVRHEQQMQKDHSATSVRNVHSRLSTEGKHRGKSHSSTKTHALKCLQVSDRLKGEYNGKVTDQTLTPVSKGQKSVPVVSIQTFLVDQGEKDQSQNEKVVGVKVKTHQLGEKTARYRDDKSARNLDRRNDGLRASHDQKQGNKHSCHTVSTFHRNRHEAPSHKHPYSRSCHYDQRENQCKRNSGESVDMRSSDLTNIIKCDHDKIFLTKNRTTDSHMNLRMSQMSDKTYEHEQNILSKCERSDRLHACKTASPMRKQEKLREDDDRRTKSDVKSAVNRGSFSYRQSSGDIEPNPLKKASAFEDRNESFLSSTRIDEYDVCSSGGDVRALEPHVQCESKHRGPSPSCISLEKCLTGSKTYTSPGKVVSCKQPVKSPSHHSARHAVETRREKKHTPSKRLRQASDKGETSESPAKRHISTKQKHTKEPLETPTRRKTWKGAREPESESNSESVAMETDDDDGDGDSSLSLTSLPCGGPGKCSKMFCFQCSMSESQCT